MTKQLLVSGIHGTAEASLEDLVSMQLNQFQGWNCQAGVQNLYIDFDGGVWIANCASTPSAQRITFSKTPKWGYLGQISDEFKLPANGVVCPIASCGCGADIVITKWKNGNSPQLQKPTIQIQELKEITSVRTGYELPKQVLWDISRRCNYDCSYCWPGVHNTTDEHKSLSVLVKSADYIIDKWAGGEKINWYFGGGEPTLNPDFEPFIQYLSDRNQWVMLVTNASQGPSYWQKNADNYNTLIFSAHFEFMKPALFAKNYLKVVELMIAGTSKLSHFIVKLMTKPGGVQSSIDFVESMKQQSGYEQLGHELKSKISFDMVPLRDINDGSKLHSDYTAQELLDIVKFNDSHK